MSPRRHPSTRLRWALGIVIGLPVLAIGVIGLAHTKAGRPLLAYLPGMGGKCPLGMDAKLTPIERERARNVALDSVRGTERAAERPALGFTLDATSREDVGNWATSHSISCTTNAAREMVCVHVPMAALQGAQFDADELLLAFDSHDRLDSVRVATDKLAPEQAIATIEDVDGALSRSVGPNSARVGELTPSYLSGPMRQTSTSFRFANYWAEARATNVGSSHIQVVEQFVSI